jgi:hypothetical protein
MNVGETMLKRSRCGGYCSLTRPEFRMWSLVLLTACASVCVLAGKAAGAALQQEEKNGKVLSLRFGCVPSDCRVRPLQTMPVQVLVDGEIRAQGGDLRKGRLRRAAGPMHVVEQNGGWLSKPFKFQGADPGGYVDTQGGGLRGVLQKVVNDMVIQDTFLYTAPDKPGTYTLEGNTEGVVGQVKVTVAADAPVSIKPEEFRFPAENRSSEPLRALAEHHAPMLAQETWWEPKADYITRFDYDNDLIGDNNWDDLEKGTSQAYLYYTALETSSHWFLIYNAFHPRDYSDKCIAGTCHENDNEGLILMIQRDGSEFGRLLAMETLAHNNVYAFSNDPAIRGGAHNISGGIEFYDGTHPVAFVESGGHGIFASTAKPHSRYDFPRDTFTAGTGVTFVYKGVAERPRHPNDRKVGYELLPILSHWWARAGSDQNQRMFDEFAAYEPFGNRPGITYARVGTTFWGRKQSANKAKPFWGWHDIKTLNGKILAPGQWALDPAYSFTQSLRFPPGMNVALDYTYNPYLKGGLTAAPAPSPNPPSPPESAGRYAVISAGVPGVAEAVGSLTAAPVTASPSIPAVAGGGWLEIQAVVDGTVFFQIHGAEVTAEVVGGQPVRDQKVTFSVPAPTTGRATWSIEKRSGRGEVRLLEQPSEENGQLLRVLVDDTRSGADRYVFRVTWKPQ